MNSPATRRAVFLMGPTGAGKSALAVELARAAPFEIVSVDSAQVYRGMDIGTAKPDAQARHGVPHHLIDIRDPESRYSAGDFLLDAVAAAEDIRRRGRLPLFVGGTMLYFHALTAGIADLPEGDPGVRAELDARAAVAGWPALHAELAAVDPEAAARIHGHDAQRIQRALEVHRLTGVPISRLQRVRSPVYADAEVVEIAVAPADRTLLHQRIDARFRAMMEAGFAAEVRGLRERSGLTAEHSSMRAVGYRQIWRHLAGQCDLDAAVDQAIAATRQLAKRQFTWLRARPRVRWVDSAQRGAISSIRAALADGGLPGWSG